MTTQLRVPPPWSPSSWSVWPTGQLSRADQLHQHGYLPETYEDRRGIPPAIAAHAIARYSHPGALVVDPDCGAGTVIIEALRENRHAVGITTNPTSWRAARANITAAKRTGAWCDAAVLDANSTADSVREAGLVGRADLVLTAIRLPSVLTNRSPDPDYTAMVVVWASMLRPGGYVVVVLRSHRAPDGTLLDIANDLSSIAPAHGLIAVHRCVALTATIRDNHITARASVAQRKAADRARSAGTPIGLQAHRTVLVMRPSNTRDDYYAPASDRPHNSASAHG